MKRRTFLLSSAALTQAPFIHAQERVTTIVLPYAPGGSLDVTCRILAQEMRDIMGRNVVVLNKPGANGLIATKQVQAAPKDGSQLLFFGPNIVALAGQKGSDYDPFKDFTPLGVFGTVDYFLSVPASANSATIADYIKYARSRPQGIFAGNVGAGGIGHMLSAAFANHAGIKATHVPYKGATEITRALRSGDLQMQLTTTSSILDQLVQAGEVRYLAVAGDRRSSLAPSVPLIRDSLPNMLTLDSWSGLFAPAGMPADLARQMSDAIRVAATKPDVVTKLAGQFVNPVTADGAGLTRLLSAAGTAQERLRKESGVTEAS